MDIPRHKVFISYYHQDDQQYKDNLINMQELNPQTWQLQSIFEDYSVHENEIDDTDLTSEQIRCIIRDEYIKDATVLILLCGQNTKKRKHIDWEIHAAMYNSDVNPQMGILVINLPTISSSQAMISNGEREQNIMGPFVNWSPLNKDITSLKEKCPYLPERIIENLARDDVQISIVNWDVISNDASKLKELIDNAYNRRKSNKYDHSTPLRRQNS